MGKRKLKISLHRIRGTKELRMVYTSWCAAMKKETSLRHTFFNGCEICLILDFDAVSLWRFCKRNMVATALCFSRGFVLVYCFM